MGPPRRAQLAGTDGAIGDGTRAIRAGAATQYVSS
jgi:hypothetical protein